MNYTNKQKRKIVKDDYNAIAQIYAESYADIKNCKVFVDKFINSLSGGGSRVLDVGCGAGQITNYLCEKGLNAIGIDFSENLLKIAKTRYPNVNFVNVDICDYQTNEKFDGVFSKDALFHIPDQDLIVVLQKFRKMLKDGGKICILMDIPKQEGEKIYVEELDDRFKIYYNYMKPEKVKNMLVEAGFVLDDFQVLQENENASSYASGLMIFQATNQKSLPKE